MDMWISGKGLIGVIGICLLTSIIISWFVLANEGNAINRLVNSGFANKSDIIVFRKICDLTAVDLEKSEGARNTFKTFMEGKMSIKKTKNNTTVIPIIMTR